MKKASSNDIISNLQKSKDYELVYAWEQAIIANKIIMKNDNISEIVHLGNTHISKKIVNSEYASIRDQKSFPSCYVIISSIIIRLWL